MSFEPERHPRIEQRQIEGPPKVKEATGKLGDRIGLRITAAVGTMTCAVLFTALALISLPGVVRSRNTTTIVAWIAQTFLQLVLLSIIIVGQNVQSAGADKRAEATFQDVDAILHSSLQLQDHLLVQDAMIEKIHDAVVPR